jgi:hypothetical protein
VVIKSISALVLVFILSILIRPITAGGPVFYLISAIIDSEDIEYDTSDSERFFRQRMEYYNLDYQLRTEPSQADDPPIRLSFYIPVDTTDQTYIFVREIESNYWMELEEKAFNGGFYTFTWNKNIINNLNIELLDLFGIGYLRSEHYNYFLPTIIHETVLPPTINVRSYIFIFQAHEMGRASIKITHGNPEKIIFESKKTPVIPDSPFFVVWNIDPSKPSYIQEGELTLLASFEAIGSFDRVYRDEYSFYHQQTIDTRNVENISGDRFEGLEIYREF